MRLEEQRCRLNEKEIMFRNARKEDAQMLIDYLKTVTGETRFLMSEPDEIAYTTEEEEQFIRKYEENEHALLMMAFGGWNLCG